MSVYAHPLAPEISTTQPFGSSPGGFNPPGGHTGEDKGSQIGVPVRAAGDGVIELAGWVPSDNNPWLFIRNWAGITVVLSCGNEEPSFNYSHLIKTDLK